MSTVVLGLLKHPQKFKLLGFFFFPLNFQLGTTFLLPGSNQWWELFISSWRRGIALNNIRWYYLCHICLFLSGNLVLSFGSYSVWVCSRELYVVLSMTSSPPFLPGKLFTTTLLTHRYTFFYFNLGMKNNVCFQLTIFNYTIFYVWFLFE